MDPTDLEEFDLAHEKLLELRATSTGAAVFAAGEAVAKSAAVSIWATAKPILLAAEERGISIGAEALKEILVGFVVSELSSLANGGK